MDSKEYLHSLNKISLEKIVKQEYREYQIYTLMDRAIPYLQDGLKPSQRRILFTLFKNQTKGLMKVSSLTGLVLTLHPHGPQSIEAAIVNMAQDFTFSNNYPLIDKKGYFGERMEPAPAAARYIECKLGKLAEILLFDDMNQVEMVPNYDEKVMEPVSLLPKLPLMLLNGPEGIGTGFSTVIPSYNHSDIIHSMIFYLEKGKARKIHPWVRYYSEKVEVEKQGRLIFKMRLEENADGDVYIKELPKGYDAQKIYKHLNKLMDEDFIKDYIDGSVDNLIDIQLVFKRGQRPSIEEIQKKVSVNTTLVPNFTLISERGVKIFEAAEEIISVFTEQRLKVVQKRYELLVKDSTEQILKNNEIIRFIKEKHYAQAEKSANRKSYVDYLITKKFQFGEYLADMPIYRMTIEEVQKRLLLIDDEEKKLKGYKIVLQSKDKIKDKLIDELNDVNLRMTKLMDDREKEKREVYKKISSSKKRS